MRELSRWLKVVVIFQGVLASLFHLYTSGFGSPEPRIMRGLHLFFLLPLIFFLYPATSKSPKHRPSIIDIGLSLISFVGPAYTIWHAERLNFRFLGVDKVYPIEVFLGFFLIIAIIEACRRALSKWMAITISVSLFYLFTCKYWPGILHFKGYSFDRVIEIMFLSGDDGIFGFLTGISANILFIYILFAGFMLSAGVGDYLVRFAIWAAGWAKGGSAKISVISSALYGTVSGSTVANVYATGSFTIPLMKKSGYKAREAAAIEAISSTGGQIMPPIMGAGSFIMSEITGISYFKIIKAAIIPALLYYLGVFSMVHLIAKRDKLKALTRNQRPKFKQLIRNIYYFLPFIFILYFLANGYSPSKSAFFVILITFGLSFLDKKSFLTPKKIIDTFFRSAVNAGLIAAALAGSGMIVATLTRTGAALAFGSILVKASFGVMVITMILVFVVVSVLGTGIPTTAAYIIAVTVGASALGNFSVEVLTIHLFVFYYAVLSDLTPPDAVTAFAAANLAGSDMMYTGVEAFRLGIAGFLVPFAFVFQPALLLKGTILQTIFAVFITGIGVVCLAIGIIGYLRSPLSLFHRFLFLLASAFLVFPTKGMEFIGVGIAILLFLGQFLFIKDRKSFASGENK